MLLVTTVSITLVSVAASNLAGIHGAIPVDGASASKGRRHDGIGGLSNSCAPWLYSYPEPQRSDILDFLFLPNFGAAVQILKIEIGGDAHSTINTEASHMHSAGDLDMRRGWEWWLAVEAKKRNPSIAISALPWGYPGWVVGNETVVYNYLVSWVKGMHREFNITVDYIGLHNEGVPSGSPPTSVEGFRKALDLAGLQSLSIVSDDSHDFGVCSQLAKEGKSSEFFKSVDVIGIHEPLRTVESVPKSCLDSGKPIWSSEAYTTFSDSNGGGCWARALNWGWVKGSVTGHMAWNLIQSYPATGSGMNYNGHGLMWADVPWTGHYVVNSPIWAMAHYTQTTEVGWSYLPVGLGSGDLPSGGTFITLVSAPDAAGKREFSLVAQTMEYDNSKCFKDTHPPFSVSNQTVAFSLSADLIPKSMTLYVRRTLLFPGDPIDPYVDVHESRNVYYEELPELHLNTSGVVTLELPINSVTTISVRRGDKGSANVPKTTPFPSLYCDNLTSYEKGRGGRFFIDQQGVFEASADGHGGTVIQQAVPVEPEEWHGWGKIKHPQTFVGPAILTSSGANISCSVRPAGAGFAGIGVGPQATSTGKTGSSPNMLAVFPNGKWVISGYAGQATVPSDGWFSLSLHVGPGGTFQAIIDGSVVAKGDGLEVANDKSFPFLGSSFGNGASFRDLCISSHREFPSPGPAPAPPAPVPPAPAPGEGLVMTECAPSDPRQQWTFTGEDGGEPGILQSCANPNVSLCLDSSKAPDAVLSPCSGGHSGIRWAYVSTTASFSSVTTSPCLVSTHGAQCHRCLDVTRQDKVDIWDCWMDFEKQPNANQKWTFDPSLGAGPLGHSGKCLGAYLAASHDGPESSQHVFV